MLLVSLSPDRTMFVLDPAMGRPVAALIPIPPRCPKSKILKSPKDFNSPGPSSGLSWQRNGPMNGLQLSG